MTKEIEGNQIEQYVLGWNEESLDHRVAALMKLHSLGKIPFDTFVSTGLSLWAEKINSVKGEKRLVSMTESLKTALNDSQYQSRFWMGYWGVENKHFLLNKTAEEIDYFLEGVIPDFKVHRPHLNQAYRSESQKKQKIYWDEIFADLDIPVELQVGIYLKKVAGIAYSQIYTVIHNKLSPAVTISINRGEEQAYWGKWLHGSRKDEGIAFNRGLIRRSYQFLNSQLEKYFPSMDITQLQGIFAGLIFLEGYKYPNLKVVKKLRSQVLQSLMAQDISKAKAILLPELKDNPSAFPTYLSNLWEDEIKAL